jgi:phenylalanyl-tRNA synthetase beta chain
MKISWKWLSTLVDLDGMDPEVLGEMLTMSGLEVEGIEAFGSDEALSTVVVAHIDTIEQHPNADRLVVCSVDAGEHGKKQVVCGAKNMAAGDKVPLAMVGTRLPGDIKIKKSKMRGVVSEGMLCAEDELGLGEGHEGLMILPGGLTPGQPVLEALEMADTVIELSVTPNRPDALSHIGVSRDIAALTGRALSWPEFAASWRADLRGEEVFMDEVPWSKLDCERGAPITDGLNVEIRDDEGCPRYAAAMLSNVKVGPSPEWMQNHLLAIGQRPINNLVDVTNYVLHECGQPLHAFDYDKLKDGQIIVRRATEGEEIVTLDGETRSLSAADLVIADPDGPVAIAGVMGGAGSEVSEGTSTVVIECAHFNSTTVRKTSKRLGMHSESSHRFERGVDPTGVPWFLRRAVELIIATQQGLGARATLSVGIIDEHPNPKGPTWIDLPVADYEGLIGAAPGAARMCEILESLDLKTQLEGETIKVRVPTLRPDIERPVDVMEEVARIEGFGALDAKMPSGTMGFSHQVRDDDGDRNATIVPVEQEQAIERVRHTLLGLGLREAVNYNFVNNEHIVGLGFDKIDVRAYPIRLRNPLSEDMDVMRTSMMVGLMTNLKHNRAHRVAGANLFEVGRVYLRQDIEAAPVPESVGGHRWKTHAEPTMLGIILADPAVEHHTGSRDWDMHDLRSMAEGVVRALSLQSLELLPYENPPAFVHPYSSVLLRSGGVTAGWMGSLNPEFLAQQGIEGSVNALELDLSRILAGGQPRPRMTPIPRFPAAQRDFALAVPAEMAYSEVEAALASFRDGRLVGHRLFDIYEGEQMEEGKKSLAISVTFRDPKGTLSEKVLGKLHEKLVAHLTRSLGAQLR